MSSRIHHDELRTSIIVKLHNGTTIWARLNQQFELGNEVDMNTVLAAYWERDQQEKKTKSTLFYNRAKGLHIPLEKVFVLR